MTTPRHKPLLAALATILLWSYTFPASKVVLAYFSAEQIVLLRYLVACFFYLVLFIAGYFPWPKWRDMPAFLILGVLSVTIYQLLFIGSVGRVTSGAAAMIVCLAPVFSALLAYVLLKEKLQKIAWVGIVVSFFGVTIISLSKGTQGELIGYLMMMVAVLSISIYFVYQKRFFTRYTPLAITAYTCFTGTLPFIYLIPQTLEAALQAPPSALLSIGIMGIFSSGIAFVLWAYALSKLPAGSVTSFLFLQPIFVIIIAWFWLNEIPPAQSFYGGAFILLGVAFILLPKKQS